MFIVIEQSAYPDRAILRVFGPFDSAVKALDTYHEKKPKSEVPVDALVISVKEL